MIAKIRHLATHTERYDTEFKFYQTIFGMKQITTGLVDDTGKSNPDRGPHQRRSHRHGACSPSAPAAIKASITSASKSMM